MAATLSIPGGVDPIEWMFEEGLTDGLPVVPPTREKVRRMLMGTTRSPGEVLGKMPPNYNEVTVEHVAINAVMAGCSPTHFRVVVAGAEAFLEDAFGLHGTASTTMGAAQFLVVNGPAREECGINMKHGVLGSGHRANATICRALKLLLNNRGGSKLGGTESSTLGSSLKYGQCIAEWEERATDWLPHHVEMGFRPEESVVTAMAACGGPYFVTDFDIHTAEDLIQHLCFTMKTLLSRKTSRINEVLLVVSPEHYDTLANGGVTKQMLRERLFELCQVDPFDATGAKWEGGGYEARMLPTKGGPKIHSADSLHIVVAGGPAGKFSAFFPGFGGGTGRLPKDKEKYGSWSVSKAIEPQPAAVDFLASGMMNLPVMAGEADVLDPRGLVLIPELELVPRVGQIEEGSTFGLVDISKPGGNIFLDKVEELLKQRYPTTKVRRYMKPTLTKPVPAETLAKIQDECKYVITALAD